MLKSFLKKFTASATEKAIAHENRFVAHNYHPLPVVLERGAGVFLWDQDGKKYMDMMSAYSAVSHGHGHPRILKKLSDQAHQLAMCSRAYHAKGLGAFAEKLAQLTGLDMVLPMNTGAEAVETAIKAARLWGYTVKGIPENKAHIITMENNFHGRTTTIVGFSTDEAYRRGFGPFAGGFSSVAYGDIAAIEAAITPDTAAVLLEPIQGEAGIVLPPDGFLQDLRALCDRHNVLLVLDEIQSGLGRTGKMFCYQHENISPDIVILGKALGGGVLPVSAVVGTKAVMSLFQPGSHGSTFGGNPLAAAVALEALAVLEEEGLVANSEILGRYFLDHLRALNHPVIKAVRGRGLWIGMDVDVNVITARALCERLMVEGILSKDTHTRTLRFAPPLCITRSEIDWFLDKLRKVLKELG